jgi:hypothetical protein
MEYDKETLRKAAMAVEIGKAILEGKEVESSYKNKEDFSRIINPSFDFRSYDYRVKEEPIYVPFTFEDAKDLIGKAVIKKGVTLVKQIIVVNSNEVGFDANNVSFENLLDLYTFIDGSPCGKIQNK